MTFAQMLRVEREAAKVRAAIQHQPETAPDVYDAIVAEHPEDALPLAYRLSATGGAR